MARGMLTQAVQHDALASLGREITTAELRLMPYIQFVMVNNQKIDPNKVNHEERNILQKWREEGHIEGGATGLAITEEFWNSINSIIWVAYVVRAEES